MTTLTITIPERMELCSLRFERAGWTATLSLDDSWLDDSGQSLYAMRAFPVENFATPQEAIDAAEKEAHALIAEINREIPLRKPLRGLPSRIDAEVDELKGLLGL